MEYLHSVRPYPVIHGDLKVQNVLVGDGLVAKVCDQFFKKFLFNKFTVASVRKMAVL